MGVKKNIKKAIELFKTAIDLGNIKAIISLGVIADENSNAPESAERSHNTICFKCYM